MRTLFYEAQNLQHDASGISDPDLFWWEMERNRVFYPTEQISIDDLNEECRNWMDSQENLPQNTSLDEIPLSLFNIEQLRVREWFMNLFNKI